MWFSRSKTLYSGSPRFSRTHNDDDFTDSRESREAWADETLDPVLDSYGAYSEQIGLA
jgi:hypothetical protein